MGDDRMFLEGVSKGASEVVSYIHQTSLTNLPKIPLYVAEWYENLKGTKSMYNLVKKMNEEIVNVSDIGKWATEDINRAYDALAKMYTLGYKIVYEDRYWLRLLDRDDGYLYLRDEHPWEFGTREESSAFQNKFTEQEINAINPAFMQFTEKVVEDEGID